jgi:hypothetical protein
VRDTALCLLVEIEKLLRRLCQLILQVREDGALGSGKGKIVGNGLLKCAAEEIIWNVWTEL